MFGKQPTTMRHVLFKAKLFFASSGKNAISDRCLDFSNLGFTRGGLSFPCPASLLMQISNHLFLKRIGSKSSFFFCYLKRNSIFFQLATFRRRAGYGTLHYEHSAIVVKKNGTHAYDAFELWLPSDNSECKLQVSRPSCYVVTGKLEICRWDGPLLRLLPDVNGFMLFLLSYHLL